ncbi:hypothetical protein [Solirubrobacter deserti]|uniref:CARDB domain-containing protein n=1 Tax=Solirubrobacter deserti TaxID=2282478 RepID=A0ABT4RMZ5_9ACTN|nr:hypothetical protein [Solirubrobacter deserti]MDA0139798.1 hypothetical protein [Solirubrobacter deserti]
MVAVVVGALVLFALFFLVRSCNDSRTDNALREYNRQVAGIATTSRQTGERLFEAMGRAGEGSPNDLFAEINSFKATAEQSLTQAQDLSVPGEMVDAQQALLIALELRRDGLEAISQDIRNALGDEGETADAAIEAIAGQNQAFNASDVIYKARVQPFIKDALDKAEVTGQEIPPSRFMNDISWVSPPFVASELDQQLSTGGEDGDGNTRQSAECTGPGLHGSGLNATSFGETTLQPGTSNRLTYSDGQRFLVSFANQGENDEFNIKVSVKISRSSGDGETITLQKTVPRVAQGETVQVELPLTEEPPIGTALNIAVTVAAAPCEEKTDNNKATYPALFDQG